MNAVDIETIKEAVRRHKDEAVGLLQDLVRIPSVNHPPTGDEKEVQEFYFRHLESMGLECEIFEPNDVPAFKEHPGRLKEHDMTNRPDVVGVCKGSGEGRSILLTAHADVELPGAPASWSDNDPFSGAVRAGRIYGRGSGDDKSGMAIAAMTPRILESVGVRLCGDLTIASVSDEEQGGANGTVALLAKGYRPDACINLDGCDQDICIANLGGGYCNIDIRVASSGFSTEDLLDCFNRFRERIAEFRNIRKTDFGAHPFYGIEPRMSRSVAFAKVSLGVEDTSRGTFTVWFRLLPGEEPEPFKKRFTEFLRGVGGSDDYSLQWTPRFLPSSEIEAGHPLVNCLKDSFTLSTGRAPSVKGAGIDDTGFLNLYGGFPSIGFGPGNLSGEGALHRADEFVDIAKLMECLETVVFCTMKWCGYERL